MTTNVYFDEIDIGDPLPEWSRTTGFMEWNRYAAINDEFVPFHMDDAAGRKGGNEQGAFGMGNLRYAYIVNALKQWIGDEAEIREVGCQYRAINQQGDLLTVTGTSSPREPDSSIGKKRKVALATPSTPQPKLNGAISTARSYAAAARSAFATEE